MLSAGCKGYRVWCMKNININYVTKMALQGTHLHRYNTATGMAEWKIIQAIIKYMNLLKGQCCKIIFFSFLLNQTRMINLELWILYLRKLKNYNWHCWLHQGPRRREKTWSGTSRATFLFRYFIKFTVFLLDVHCTGMWKHILIKEEKYVSLRIR